MQAIDIPFEVVEAYPFPAALKKCLEIAGKTLMPYTLILDADVILHPHILPKIQEEANRLLKNDPRLFFIDFFVFDKFRGKCCSGCHLYINRHVKSLLQHPFEHLDPLRPENHLVLDFAQKTGLTHTKSHLVVGLHDFEQYYSTLYAKFFRRALRRKEEAAALIELVKERKKYFLNDPDFDVVLKALEDGLRGEKSPDLFDARTYRKIEEIMPLVEKS